MTSQWLGGGISPHKTQEWVARRHIMKQRELTPKTHV